MVYGFSRNYKPPVSTAPIAPPRNKEERRLQSNDLSSDVLPSGLLVVHDAGRGGQDDVPELTRGQEPDDPFLKVGDLDRVAGGDAAGLVDAAVELDDNLACAVVVDLLELADVACGALADVALD